MTGRLKYREVEIPVPWGTIKGKDWGDPEGYPWLGLHGWLDNAGTWDALAPDWPAGHRLVAIDYPGHGLSSHAPAGSTYHYLDGVTHIERITRHLGWKNFSLLGHSMGAGMCSVHASLYPDKVDALIMIDLIKPVARDPDTFIQRTRDSVDQLLSLEAKFTNMRGKVYKSKEEAYKRLLEGAIQINGENSVTDEAAHIILERGVIQVEGGFMFSRDLRHRVGSLYGLHPEYLEQVAQNIKCRHLLIKATRSPNYEPDEKIDRILNLYKQNPLFQYRVLEGNHHLHLNTPESVLPAVSLFVEQTKPGQAAATEKSESSAGGRVDS